jgi:hypothetical protein
MTEQPDDAAVERFPPTSGRISGYLGLATAGLILVLSLSTGVHHRSVSVTILCLLGALLVWASLLRPAVWVTRDDLVLRGMFHTDRLPLAAIDKVVVTQVLAVSVDGRRFVSPAIGYSIRQTMKSKRSRAGEVTDVNKPITDNHQLFVETRVLHLSQEARDRLGIRKGSPEQQALAAGVRRTWALPEIGAAVLLVLAFLAWTVVG